MRRTFLPSADDPARHNPSFEVPADQSEHALVFDVTLYRGHQNVVIHSIKELLQIEFHAPAVARRHMGAGGFDGLMSASARTKAVAVVRKQRIEDWRELLQQRLLDQAIHDAGDTQLSCAAFGFGDIDGAYTLRVVFAGQQPSLEDRPILFHVARQLVDRHAIGTRCALVADHALIRTLEVGGCKHPHHQRVRLRVRPRHRRRRCLRPVSLHPRIPSRTWGNSFLLENILRFNIRRDSDAYWRHNLFGPW
ncbi:hypothetical protein D3C85_1141770 [compost metagenome]